MKLSVKISKREYNSAVKTVKAYELQQSLMATRKRNTGYYSILYLLDGDGSEDFRERLIKASSPDKAIEKFTKRSPISLRWVDEDLEMNGQSYYIGQNQCVKDYL